MVLNSDFKEENWLEGPNDVINSMENINDKYLIIGSADKKVYIYDDSLKFIKKLDEATGYIWDVCSINGKFKLLREEAKKNNKDSLEEKVLISGRGDWAA